MISRKINKVLGTVIGVMGFMLAIGMLDMPAYAEDKLQAASTMVESTNSTGATNKDYFVNVNKTVEQNGLKITLEKVVATKHKLTAVVKVESSKAFDKNKDDNSIIQLIYGENNFGGGGMSSDYLDDKTRLITIEKDNDRGEFPQKGEIRLDLVYPYYKVNIGMNVDVDFSESFDNIIEKDIEEKILGSDCTLKNLETDVLGTTISYTEPRKDHDDRFVDSSIILKAGDRMYKLRSSGSTSDDKETKGTYESKALTYDRLKDKNDLSIMPLSSNITWNEIRGLYKNNNKKEDANKVTANNVSYIKSFDFSDGTKGDITKIERNDTTVKVYCKGASEKASLLMASGMRLFYHFEEGATNYVNYDSDSYMSFYKDPKDTLGYIVEFSNLEKDKALELTVDNNVGLIDRYKAGEEIKIAK